MNNLIIFHLLSFLLTIINCSNTSTQKNHLKKTKFKSLISLIIGISIIILIILSFILLYLFYIRKRINNKNERVKRQMKEYDIPITTYNINELDTIQTVGTPSEFTNHHHSETDIKTII